MPLITQAAKAFEMVARYGSIRKAADRINASPSAVNRQILNLEMEFGVPLFERHSRGMRLTEAGQDVLDQVRDWQRKDQSLRSSIENLTGSRGVQVKIGIMECLAADFLMNVFAQFQDQYPGASLDTTVGGTAEITTLLMSGNIDLAIVFNLPRDRGLKVIHEVQVPLGAVMSHDHPLAGKTEVQSDELCDYPLALADNRLTIGPVVHAMLERSRRPVNQAVMSNSVTVLKAFALRGSGLSILTSVDVYQEVNEGHLKFALVEGARMYEMLSISVRDDRALSRSSRKMVEILCSAMDNFKQA